MQLSQIPNIVKIVDQIDQRKENRLRPKTKVNHMNTRTTKQAMQITEAMQKELGKIGSDIVKLLDRNFSLKEIKDKFQVRVGTIIAGGVRESYLLGFHFVESFEERTIKLSKIHLDEIDKQIDIQIESFWNNISSIIAKQEKSKIASAAGPRDLFLLNAFNNFFANSAVSMNFFALSQGTITTQQQAFKEDIKLAKNKKITIKGSVKVPHSIWISERDRSVCPICINLDGRTWPVTDQSMPRPVQDSHFGCRCRLLPIDNSTGKIFNA